MRSSSAGVKRPRSIAALTSSSSPRSDFWLATAGARDATARAPEEISVFASTGFEEIGYSSGRLNVSHMYSTWLALK